MTGGYQPPLNACKSRHNSDQGNRFFPKSNIQSTVNKTLAYFRGRKNKTLSITRKFKNSFCVR